MSEIVLPKQLNRELLESALKNVLDDKSVKVLNFQTKPAASSGDNYTSDVYRVLVEYLVDGATQKKSLIVKFMLEIEMVTKLLNEYKFFVKEKEIYSNILPIVSKMMFNEQFAPKCYSIMEEPSQMFVMEDLKESGYIVVDRQAGLDLEHCKVVVKKLAKMHAASMVLAESDPEMFQIFDFGLINKNSTFGSAMPSIFIAGLGSLIEESANWPDFQEITEKLKGIKDNFEDRAIKCIDQENSFKVLNHGDLWTNNFMIKYEDNKQTPVDVLFIDHQIGYFSSMGIDWNYFITLSANNTVKVHHRDLLLETYYSALIEFLTKLNYSRSKFPTLKNVQDEVANYEFYGFIATVGILPLVLMDRNTGVVSDIEALQDESAGEEVRKIQFRGKIFQESIKLILKRFNAIGVLD